VHVEGFDPAGRHDTNRYRSIGNDLGKMFDQLMIGDTRRCRELDPCRIDVRRPVRTRCEETAPIPQPDPQQQRS
jgi:hypothetical protein